jgi:hypothetical protein
MKRNTLLFFILIILLFAALYFFFSRGPGALNDSGRQFSVADTSLIQKIEISFRNDSVFLERHEGRWMVNGRYYARDRLIINLMAAMQRLQQDAPVSRKNREEILRQLQDNSKNVTITIEGKRDKIFYAWYDSLNGGVICMVMERSDQPFRMQVPGLSAAGIYSLFSADESTWRDNVLFRIQPGRLSEVEVSYSDRPDASFRIEKNKEGEWTLAGIPGNKIIENFSKDKLLGYLYQFSNVRFDEIISAGSGSVPEEGIGEATAVISMKDTEGTATVVTCYPRYIREDSGKWVMDFNRLYLRVSGTEEILLARYIRLDLILKDLSWFLTG